MAQTTNFDRRRFWKYVAKKLKYAIHASHVESVINILFDEIVQDLEKEIIIPIGNFGKFVSKKMAPRKHHDINSGEFIFSPGNKTLRFYLNKKFRLFLIKKLDIDKTFENNYNE